VVTASNVHEACEAAKKDRFQLLISDIGLPDGTGHEVMRRLGADTQLKGIAVSGYGMQEDLELSREAGFSAHLTKPLGISDLEEAIAEVSGKIS
jgi:CheY-like chemotaxis protein